MMSHAPVILYLVLFLATMFAPLRWSIVAFLLLVNIDLGSLSASIGILNTAKAMVLPVFLLWRFNRYAGHSRLAAAPVLWCLLTVYVAVASTWSFYPAYAIKLIGHMIGSLIICLMLMRATKGGYLTFQTLVPASCGVLGMAVFHWIFLHNWGGETERFTTFSGAQSFAAFAAALYCACLLAKPLQSFIRIPLCVVLVAAIVANGSRTWIIGVVASTFVAILISQARQWIKILTFGAAVIAASAMIIQFGTLMEVIAQDGTTNRIASAIVDVYGGNFNARGLGTYNLRHALFERTIASIEQGSTEQMIFGHGTSNGALIAATLNKDPDPNRSLHDEWLRALYEWGVVGFLLWLAFFISLVLYAARGVLHDRVGYSKPLLAYLPAFALGLTGENIIAGAGNAVSVGLLVLIAFSSISHRHSARSASFSRRRATALAADQAATLQAGLAR